MIINRLSEQLLLQVKKHEETQNLESVLQQIPFDQLSAELFTDDQKKAFWINIYNAFFQLLRREGINKPAIFRDKLIVLAGKSFSLDHIEHGILRKYRLKWSLGYLSDLFTPAVIRRLAVQKIDYRIHFALNCGAKSCPPIAFYSPNQLDQQLDRATISFLENDIEISKEKKEIHITALMKWFLADFGGIKGIRELLNRKLAIDPSGMKIHFKTYNWEEALDNFR